MLVLTGAFILLFIIFWRFLTDYKPPILGVYSQPSRLHSLKKTFIYYILNWRKQQKLKSDGTGQTAGYGVKSRSNAEDMDKPQPLSDKHPKVRWWADKEI